jgi:hypothetical protein
MSEGVAPAKKRSLFNHDLSSLQRIGRTGRGERMSFLLQNERRLSDDASHKREGGEQPEEGPVVSASVAPGAGEVEGIVVQGKDESGAGLAEVDV